MLAQNEVVRIVVAPDKFKGTLTAVEAARAIAAGIRAAAPDAEIVALPMGDGGEGSLFALLGAAGGDAAGVSVTGPLGGRVDAPVGYLADGRLFVEAASASGLWLLDEPNPLHTATTGTGELIAHAARASGKQIVVGVGGTASTDGGTGAARAVGWRFLDAAGRELAPGGGILAALESIDGAHADERIARADIVAACDVATPLTGPRGAARVFSPQKGAHRKEVRLLEAGLERLAEIVHRDLGIDLSALAGGGAGGGLGAGLHAFFGARLVSGFDLIASASGLRGAIAGCDLVVTGEGRLDDTTAEGKVVDGVARLALEASVDCFLIAGEVTPPDGSVERRLGLSRCVSLVERYGRDRARGETRVCLADAAAVLFRD